MNSFIKWIFITATIFFLISVCSFAGEQTAEREVKKLIVKRADVMESVIFGQITYDEGCRQLKEFETGSIYEKDVSNLKKYINTDLSKIQKLEFVSINEKTRMYNKISFEVEILWVESYGTERECRVCIYDVGAQVNEGEYMLTTFEIQKD